MSHDPGLSRICGRCRGTFPADPTADPVVMAEWWACDPCRLALLGVGPRPASKPTSP